MEQFDLIRKNNYYYFKINNKNVIVDLAGVVNCFSKDYKAIRIDSKLIEKSELSMDNFNKQLKELNNLSLDNNLNNMFSNMLDMLKSNSFDMFNNNMLSGMFNNFKNQNLFSLENKINEKIDLLIGLEGIKNYIILIDYKNMKILFFRKKEEVGKLIGRSFRILDTNKSFYNILDNVFSYKGEKLIAKLDSEVKDYISCSSKIIKLLNKDLNKEVESMTIENDKKAYKFKFSILNTQREFFVAKSDVELSVIPKLPIPEMPNIPNMFPDMDIDLSIPISLFSDAVLIDGVNNKFAYLKKDYADQNS